MFPVIIIASANFKIINFLRYHVKTTYSKNPKKKKETKREFSLKRLNKIPEIIEENESCNTLDATKSEDKIKIEIIQNYSFKNDKKFARSKNILALVSLSFIVCWLPLLLFNTFLDFSKEKTLKGQTVAITYLITHLIAMTQCCINPILYGLENTNFKHELYNMVSTYFSTTGTKVENDDL